MTTRVNVAAQFRTAGIPAGVSSSIQPKHNNANVAAFFDLDGTLLPLPSLEYRLWRLLRHRKRIRASNHLAWLKETLRLLPRGISYVVNANKAYLRGILAEEQSSLTIPPFFPEAIQQVAWHAGQHHHVVILSGTLKPLAVAAADLLTQSLARLGLATRIEVRATKLELAAGSWTGRIIGEAIFGAAKARAVRRFCSARGIDPTQCFAYGDTAQDRWLLEAIGKPAAVNPSDDLARIARRNDWPVLRWRPRRATQNQLNIQKNNQSVFTSVSPPPSIDEVQIATIAERESCR